MNEKLLPRLVSLLDEMKDLLVRDKTPDGGDHYERWSFTDRDIFYQYVDKDHEFMYLLSQYNGDCLDYVVDVIWTGASMETVVKESYSILRKMQ
jgi:hypothetical protein